MRTAAEQALLTFQEQEQGHCRDLQVGCGTEAEFKVTHAYIIGHNTIQHCSLEIQLCASYGYQLKL